MDRKLDLIQFLSAHLPPTALAHISKEIDDIIQLTKKECDALNTYDPIKNPSTLAEREIDYLTKYFGINYIDVTKIFDTGIEPDYQGCILILHTCGEILSPSLIEDLTIDLNMGDASYTITHLGDTYYKIEICE